MKKIRFMIAVIVALGLMLPLTTTFADVTVIPPASKPFGFTFKEWSAQWWQFVLSFPFEVNPLLDENGDRCAFGQRGPVWFLMGTVAGVSNRTCSIPEGKVLFFPVINLVDVNVTNQTAAELRAEIAPCLDSARKLSVRVDGKPIAKVDNSFRVRSEVFEVTLPQNNVFGLDPGTYSPAVDDGFYVMLEPLAAGPHTVRYSGESGGCPIFGNVPFSVDVTYTLNVVPVVLE